MISFEIF